MRESITVEFSGGLKSDGTLPLPIISLGREQGLIAEEAARVFGLTDIKMRRLIYMRNIPMRKILKDRLEFLKKSGLLPPKATGCMWISRASLYLLQKAIGTSQARDAFAAIWRRAVPENPLRELGKVVSPKMLLSEALRKIKEQERRIAKVEEQIEKIQELLLDSVTLEAKEHGL